IGGSELELGLVAPGQSGTLMVEIAYDPSMLEAKQPVASSPGRLMMRVDQGRGNLRFQVLSGARGDTRIDIIGASLEGGEPYPGAIGSHTVKLNSP
ncbi:MAG: hypothetical protein WAR41_08435, partial [Azonexus sp.]